MASKRGTKSKSRSIPFPSSAELKEREEALAYMQALVTETEKRLRILKAIRDRLLESK